MTNKLKLADIKNLLDADSISKRGDIITIRKGYFYRMGQSTQSFIDKVIKAFPNAEIIDSGDHYASFRGGSSIAQGSHWFVKFIIK